jgi:hypothetical protein
MADHPLTHSFLSGALDISTQAHWGGKTPPKYKELFDRSEAALVHHHEWTDTSTLVHKGMEHLDHYQKHQEDTDYYDHDVSMAHANKMMELHPAVAAAVNKVAEDLF